MTFRPAARNGDGKDDILIGAPNATASTAISNPAGQVFLVFGR